MHGRAAIRDLDIPPAASRRIYTKPFFPWTVSCTLEQSTLRLRCREAAPSFLQQSRQRSPATWPPALPTVPWINRPEEVDTAAQRLSTESASQRLKGAARPFAVTGGAFPECLPKLAGLTILVNVGGQIEEITVDLIVSAGLATGA